MTRPPLFFPIRKLYRNAIGNFTSYDYLSVIPTTATFVNPDFHLTGKSTCSVPFQATNPVPAQDTVPPNLSYIFSLKQSKTKTPLMAAVADYAMKLEWIIEEFWDTGFYHVQLHSSGWDSRIISSVMRKLYKKHGKDWLGDIHFVCAKWEGDEFLEIMRRQGWDPSQYTVYNENVPENEYFASAFEFGTAWQQLRAASTFPVNQWWFMIDDLQKEGRLPDSDFIQVITGLWANETMWCLLEGGKKFADNFKRLYCHVMASLPVKAAGVFLPFTHYALLDALPTYGCGAYAGVNGAEFRRALALHICPELDDIPNVAAKDPMHPISQRLFEKVKDDYRHSKFASVRPNAPSAALPITNFSEWWANWSLASLWEYMDDTGYNFVVRN